MRKENDQDFQKLNNLIINSLASYKDIKININLWNRFWKAIVMYNSGETYETVLKSLFGAKSSKTISHKKK